MLQRNLKPQLFHKLIAEATVKVEYGFISSSSSQFYGAKRTVYYYLLVNFKRLQIKTILLSKQGLVDCTVWQLSGFFEEGNKLFSAVLHIHVGFILNSYITFQNG